MLDFYLLEKMCGGNRDDEETMTEHFMADQSGMGLIALAIAVVAAYLAWHKNAHEEHGLRILITLFAFLFGQLYLIYYVIRYVFMEQMGKGGGRRKGGKKRGKGRK